MCAANDEIPPGMLGFRKDPNWRDMSKYLVHFTKTAEDLGLILTQGHVKAGGPHGWGRNISEVAAAHHSACLSEIPLDQLDRLRKRHGRYGVGFLRGFVRAAGGARVWYLDQGSPPHTSLFQWVGQLMHGRDFNSPLWRLTPFVDPVIPGRNEWDWEREWRVQGGLSFNVSDVAFVILPAGDSHVITEGLGLDAPVLDIEDEEDFWDAISDVLADAVEKMAAQFLENYEDPIDFSPIESGAYVELVTHQETEDAVEALFPELEEKPRADLCGYLNNISTQWLSKEEIDDFYEDSDDWDRVDEEPD